MINQQTADTPPSPEQEKQPPPVSPQEQPLLANHDHKIDVDNTISSIDSNLSNSDNCSDIEMGRVDAHRNISN